MAEIIFGIIGHIGIKNDAYMANRSMNIYIPVVILACPQQVCAVQSPFNVSMNCTFKFINILAHVDF